MINFLEIRCLKIIGSSQILVLYYNKKLDHIPSTYIDLMVHVVKGRQYTHRCRGLNRRDSLRPTLSFEFRCFNQRR